jgi:hypothetical protein
VYQAVEHFGNTSVYFGNSLWRNREKEKEGNEGNVDARQVFTKV